MGYPIQSGHPCLECSEDGFRDNSPFNEHNPTLNAYGIEATADKTGLVVGAPLLIFALFIRLLASIYSG